MEKTIRVAPRNIQFKDKIQVREIPNNDEELFQSVRKNSWDPNLNVRRILFLHKLTYFIFIRKMYSLQNQQNQQNKKMLLLDVLSVVLC
jgi:hypothetical protein